MRACINLLRGYDNSQSAVSPAARSGIEQEKQRRAEASRQNRKETWGDSSRYVLPRVYPSKMTMRSYDNSQSAVSPASASRREQEKQRRAEARRKEIWGKPSRYALPPVYRSNNKK